MNIDDPALASQHRLEGAAEIIDKRAPAAPKRAKPRRSPVIAWLKGHRRLAVIVGTLVAIVILLGIFVLPRFTGGAKAGLILATVTRGDIEATVTALGNVQPKNYVDVGAQVSGQIKTLAVDVGDKVKKGDLLAEIDAQVQQARVEADDDNLKALQADLVDKQAQLTLKKAQYERQVRLDKEGATSKDDLQTAKAAYESQQAQIDATQSQIKQAQSTLQADSVTLSYAKILAPMDGTVVSLSARLGQTLNSVQQAPTILRIADLSLMQIWTQVSEADVAKLKVGVPVYFSTLGNPSRRYDSTLAQILPTPETVNNVILFDALFDMPNPDGSLMTQMTAQVSFVTASAKNVLLVPAAAVHPLTGRGRRGALSGQAGQAGQVAGSGAQRTPAPAAGRAGDQAFQRGAGQSAAPGTAATNGASTGARRGGSGKFAATHGTVDVMGADGKIETRMVETGVSDRVNTEIKSGLKEGEQVVVGAKVAAAKPVATAPGQQQAGRSPLQAGGNFGPPGGRGGR